MNLQDPNYGPQWRLFLFLFIVTMAVIGLDATGVLGDTAYNARDPLVSVSNSLRGVRNIFNQPQDLQQAQTEIQQLQLQVAQLQRENESLQALEGEYLRLSTLLGRVVESTELTRVTASVVGRGTNPNLQDLIIDQGSNSGIRVGMPVEGISGLVGQVYRTTATSAQVLLVTDVESRVIGRLQGSREVGVISGNGGSGLLTMRFVAPSAIIAPNEIVSTAGVSSAEELIANRFPPNLELGKVIGVDAGQAELFQSLTLQPISSFDSLEEVFVITNYDPIDASVFESDDPR